MRSDHPEYAHRRRALSTAFFKSKFEMMSEVINDVTLQHISKTLEGLKVGEGRKVDLVKFFRDLQSAIIISIICGKG
jgi:cytochrome P450